MTSARTNALPRPTPSPRCSTWPPACDAVVQQTAGAWGPMTDVSRVAGTEGTLWIEAGRVWHAGATSTVRCLDVPDDLGCRRPRQRRAPIRVHRFTHLELGPYTRLAEAFAARISGRPSVRRSSPRPLRTVWRAWRCWTGCGDAAHRS